MGKDDDVPGADLQRLKVHRRTTMLDGQSYTLLAPRPGDPPRFATNRRHGAWQVVTDQSGVLLLGRLFWAMAFQRRPRTVVVIDPAVLVPNPFDGEPSVPIVIVNLDLGPFDRSAVDALCGQLPFSAPSDGTVVLQTRGLDLALADWEAFSRRERKASPAWRTRASRRFIERVNGMLVITAPPPVLRSWGASISLPQSRESSTPDGEIRLLEAFSDRVAQAQAVRERLFPGRAHAELSEEELREVRGAQPAEGDQPTAPATSG
jgi:hypothetical protein